MSFSPYQLLTAYRIQGWEGTHKPIQMTPKVTFKMDSFVCLRFTYWGVCEKCRLGFLAIP